MKTEILFKKTLKKIKIFLINQNKKKKLEKN